jgi:hypothetical protein
MCNYAETVYLASIMADLIRMIETGEVQIIGLSERGQWVADAANYADGSHGSDLDDLENRYNDDVDG